MKVMVPVLLLAAVAMIPLAGLTDEKPPAESLPLSEIVMNLEMSEYAPIVEASFDDGVWEIEAYKGDAAYELLIEPTTGKIQSEEREDAEARPPAEAKPLSEILAGLEKAGFTAIEEISFERRTWEVEAYRENAKRELHVNPRTGEIVSEQEDD